MPRPKRGYDLVPLMVRVHPDTAAWIDAQRGERSRSDFVKGLVLKTMRPAQIAKAQEEMLARMAADPASPLVREPDPRTKGKRFRGVDPLTNKEIWE